MTPCVSCATPMPAEHDFCTQCGWPRKQPSPYGGDAKSLPVISLAEAPERDDEGRALAYDADSRSGRAYIPGERPGAVDKITDYPSAAGPGNRLSGEVMAGLGGSQGAHATCIMPVGCAIGAGRLVWGDGTAVFEWSFSADSPKRTPLSISGLLGGQDALVAIGWRTYLAGENGLVVHHGLSGQITTLVPGRVTAQAAMGTTLVAALGNQVLHFQPDGSFVQSQTPFPVASLAADGANLAAFGEEGQIASCSGDAWHAMLEPQTGAKLAQGWVVNGRAGVRLTKGTRSEVHYAPTVAGQAPPQALPVETDAALSIVAGKSGWDAHRLVGFVGGTRPRALIYMPGDPGGQPDERALPVSSIGRTLTVVRRVSDGSGAITFVVEDPTGPKLVFENRADGGPKLPASFQLIANCQKTWLLPHRNGVVVLAYEGQRAVVNSIPYPA